MIGFVLSICETATTTNLGIVKQSSGCILAGGGGFEWSPPRESMHPI